MIGWLWLGCGTGTALVTGPGPVLTVFPERLSFEPVAVGEAASATFTVTNDGEPDLGVRATAFGDPAFRATAALDRATAADGSALALDPANLLLPAGASLPFDVVFAPDRAGPVVTGLRVETFGDGASSFPDPRRAGVPVVASGSSPLDATMMPWPRFDRIEDLGWATAATVARPSFGNDGAVAYGLSTAQIPGCDRAFSLMGGLPAVVDPGGAADVEVAIAPESAAPLRCDLEVTTDLGPDFPVLVSTLVVNTPDCTNDGPPEVVLVSPSAGVLLSRTAATTITVRVADGEQPEPTLDCRVTSAVKGKTIASCGLVGPGPVEIDVPVPSIYAAPTVDVWTVVATDACGGSHSASLPVLIDTGWPRADEDGDGYDPKSTPPDCNERDGTIYPYAAELDDGKDNDCDGRIDEGTAGVDDDGDSRSEDAGDCDDHDAAVFPGAVEQANDRDDDCDGAVDEGTLSGDDDGDGFAERDGDCADDDVARRPGAGEDCRNGLDDDCDGAVDEPEDCREKLVPPGLSPLVMSATAVGPGESVALAVYAVGAPTTVSWRSTRGALSSGAGEAVSWTAPDSPGPATIVATARTADGHELVVEGTIEVLQAPPTVEVPGESLSGCASGGSAAGVAALAGLFVRRPRRAPGA